MYTITVVIARDDFVELTHIDQVPEEDRYYIRSALCQLGSLIESQDVQFNSELADLGDGDEYEQP